MINESSIALAEPIAVAGFDIKPSAIIAGLNGESCGLDRYTDNFRTEIVQVTSSDDISHNSFMKEGTARMAEIIRTTLSNISEYGKPLALAIAKGAENCYSVNELKQIATASFRHRFVHLDDPFFNSPLFPKEVKEKGLGFMNVSLDSLKSLVFEAPTEDQISDFIGVNHPDITEATRTRDYSMQDAAYILSNLDSLCGLFVRASNGNIDFSKVKSMESERLIKVYVLLTRMYASEDIPCWFKGGELSKYREFVNLLWNGMTLYLLTLKKNVDALRARRIVMSDQLPVTYSDSEGDSKTRIMRADVTCYYTDEALKTITDADCSMSEVLTGYYWEKLQGNPVTIVALLENPGRFQDICNKYFHYVHEKLLMHAKDRFIDSSLKVIEQFIINNPLVLERVAATGQLVGNWVRARFIGELERGYFLINKKNPNLGGGDTDVVSLEEAIMSTHIVPSFMRHIGCDMAAEILEETFVTQTEEDNIDNKKGRLTVSVINLIARKCFV